MAQIRRAGTPVWCPNNSWVAWRACGEIRPMLHLVGELFASGGEGGSRLPRPLVRELEERRLAVLVFQESPVPMMGDSYSFLARDPRFRPLHRLIGRHYRVEEPIPIPWPTPISGYPRVGLQVRPARIVPAREEP